MVVKVGQKGGNRGIGGSKGKAIEEKQPFRFIN